MARTSTRWWLREDNSEAFIESYPEMVYDLVSDLTRMGQWSPECQRVEWLEGSTAPVVGATFIGHNEGGPRKLMKWSRRGRILAAERGREFAFVTEEGNRDSTEWRYHFEAVEGGTRVVESYKVWWIPSWARLLDVPTNRARELNEAMAHTLCQLKSAVESAAAPEN